jgi:hypothetical protein
MAVLVDSFTNGNYGNSFYAGSISKSGETFVPNASGSLYSAKFQFEKVGSPTGTMVFTLYNITGTPGVNAKATGTVLATSSSLDVSTISSGSLNYYELLFPAGQQYIINSGNNYCIIAEYTSTFSDGSNRIRQGGDVSGSDSGANGTYYSSSTWYSDTNTFVKFYVYATPPPQGLPGNIIRHLSVGDGMSRNERAL